MASRCITIITVSVATVCALLLHSSNSMYAAGMQAATSKDSVFSYAENLTRTHALEVVIEDSFKHKECASAAGQCYGEPTASGLRHLLESWPTQGECALLPNSSFYDVGSGFGRVAAAIWLKFARVHSTGIEINSCRAARAATFQASLQRAVSGNGHALLGRLAFALGDVTKHGLRDATHVFMSSQCWPEPLLVAMFGTLAGRSPNLRCMVSFAASRPWHWSPQVEKLADAWGHVADDLRHVSTTWGGATAIFLSKGPCARARRGRGSSTSPPYRSGCRTLGDALNESSLHVEREMIRAGELPASATVGRHARHRSR